MSKIEKINFMIKEGVTESGQEYVEYSTTAVDVAKKVNEIIDFLNGDASNEWETEQDYFSEEWIGKLCRFWNIDANNSKHENCHYGILTRIYSSELRKFEADNGIDSYRYCEPIDDEDLEIYHGTHKPHAWESGVPVNDLGCEK